MINVNQEEIEKRGEELKMIARKIQESGLQFPDIRYRDWSTLDTKVAKLLNLLIEAENILIDLDEYQMENEQCYPEIEDMMLQLGVIRERYTEFVDNHNEVLLIGD